MRKILLTLSLLTITVPCYAQFPGIEKIRSRVCPMYKSGMTTPEILSATADSISLSANYDNPQPLSQLSQSMQMEFRETYMDGAKANVMIEILKNCKQYYKEFEQEVKWN